MLEETERLRDEETKCREGEFYANGEDISGIDCLAKGNGFGACYISSNSADAQGRAIRTDAADSSSGCFDSFKYCRGVRQTKPAGFAQISSDFAGFSERNGDPNRTGSRSRDADAGRYDPLSSGRSG